MSTAGWLSAAVENTWDFEVGIVVFLSINGVITLPIVSIPSESGVTSSNTMSLTSPVNTPPWIAAPIATTSSGLTPLDGSLPNSFLINSWTFKIRVEPPTNNTLSMSLADNLASFKAFLTGSRVDSVKSSVKDSNLALESDVSKLITPSFPCAKNGNEICVIVIPDKSFLAFSAASCNLCIAILSLDKSTPCSFLISSTKKSTILWS